MGAAEAGAPEAGAMIGGSFAVFPTLVGPVVSAVVIVTVGILVGKSDPLLGGPFMNWLIGVVLFSLLALVIGAAMLGADALLVAFGRRPIDGRCAWIAGLLAPLAVEMIWLVAPPRNQQGLMFVVTVFGPIVCCAGLVRLAASALCAR
jgi:hypothetical protein